MTKKQIIDRIYKDTFNVTLGSTRMEEIEAYIELWEKYKNELENRQ